MSHGTGFRDGCDPPQGPPIRSNAAWRGKASTAVDPESQPAEATFRLQRPDGQLAAPELTIALGQGSARSRTLVMQTNGLEIGTYLVTLRVESERLTREFEVRSDPDAIARVRAASSLV